MSAWATQQEISEHFCSVIAPNCATCGTNPCSFQCPNSPRYYSPEQERADADWQEHLSEGEFMSLAMAQYEREHGVPYVS